MATAIKRIDPAENETVASLEAKPMSVEKAVERVETILAEAPVAMTQAIESVSAQKRTVMVRFHPPNQLRQTQVQDRLVECLLYQ